MLLINPGRFPPPSNSGQFILTATDELFTSPDGVTWTSRTVPVGHWARTKRVLGTTIICLNRFGQDDPDPAIVSTDDGATWSAITMPAETYEWAAVAEGSGVLAVVGDPSGTNPMASSTNATSWTARAATVQIYRGVLWAAGLSLFIAYAEDGASGIVETSPNGTTWTNRSAGAANHYWGKEMAWSGTRACVVGSDLTDNSTQVLTSTNGTSWSIVTPGHTEKANTWDRTIWDGTQFVALGYDLVTGTATDGIIVTSPDGTTWTAAYISAMVDPRGLCWTGTEYALMAGSGAEEIWTSPDLTTWTLVGTQATGSGNRQLEWIPD